MFKNTYVLLALLLFSFYPVDGQASEDPSWELSGETNLNWIHSFGANGQDASNQLQLQFGADYFLSPQFELGVIGSYLEILTNEPTNTILILAAGPVFNFGGEDAAHSFYLEGRVGAQLYEAEGYEFTSFYYKLGLGHRFALTSHASWKPEFVFSGYTSATNQSIGFTIYGTRQIAVVPLQLSILF